MRAVAMNLKPFKKKKSHTNFARTKYKNVMKTKK